MKHDWTTDLLTYWDKLRGTRAAPDRRDISPRALGSKLPNIFILRSGDEQALSSASAAHMPDIPPARQWQFRLAGTRLCTFYGRELRNMRFLSLWHDDIRPWLAEQLHLSGLDYRPLRLEHTGITLAEKTCHFETLLLPLHEADGTLAWIGSMIPLEQPLWLGSEPLISNLIGLETQEDHITSRAGSQEAGIKSVLQILLERHHDFVPQQAAVATKANMTARANMAAQEENTLRTTLCQTRDNPRPAATGSANIPVADTAFSRALLPQLGALMPPAHPAGRQQASEPAAAVSTSHTGGHNPAMPLTVADLIRSIHEAKPQAETARQQRKPAHLTLISGGKDKA